MVRGGVWTTGNRSTTKVVWPSGLAQVYVSEWNVWIGGYYISARYCDYLYLYVYPRASLRISLVSVSLTSDVHFPFAKS